MATPIKELVKSMRERVREIEAESARLKKAIRELDSRGRKPNGDRAS